MSLKARSSRSAGKECGGFPPFSSLRWRPWPRRAPLTDGSTWRRARLRAIWVARPDLPPISRFFAGIASFLSRPARLFGVLVFYALATAALYFLWLWLDPSAGGEARLALVPLILTQQVFVFIRSLVKVGYYAGISEALTRAPSPEYSYVAAPAAEPAASGGAGTLGDEGSLDRPAGGI